ncbi:MAG: methyltransferase domain-containing protein [bacterium]|nr:methyltransferase domain-containing protein [bacterium]
MKILLTTSPGLEDFVETEIKEHNIKITSIEKKPFNTKGLILITTDSGLNLISKKLLKLRSIYFILELLHIFKISDTNPLNDIRSNFYDIDFKKLEKARSFRVTTSRTGLHSFISRDVQIEAGSVIVQRYGLNVELKNPEIIVRANIYDKLCVAGFQINREDLSNRNKAFTMKTSLKGSIAYAMIKLACITNTRQVNILDPFCGTGTILLEAAFSHPNAVIYGSDAFEKPYQVAIKNIENKKLRTRVHIQQCDAAELTKHFERNFFCTIISNLPFGAQLSKKADLRILYARFLKESYEILEPGACMVILILKKHILFELLKTSKKFSIEREINIKMGPLKPSIFKIRKA